MIQEWKIDSHDPSHPGPLVMETDHMRRRGEIAGWVVDTPDLVSGPEEQLSSSRHGCVRSEMGIGGHDGDDGFT